MVGNWSGSLGIEKPGWRRFLLLSLLGAAIWALILRFFFPNYFDPTVPFHPDHLIYLGDSAEGYGLMRYIEHYPRPLGNAIFDLLGRLGIRGMLVPVFLLTLANGTLIILYIERLTGQTTRPLSIAVFLLLVYANPESYASVKEDILAVIYLTLVLLIFHCWQNYLESGRTRNIYFIVLAAFIGSYIKETYFVTLIAFFAIQILAAGVKRKTALILTAVNIAIAALSLAYNAHIAVFVNPHAEKNGPYYQNWSPISILHGYHALLKWLVFPAPAVLIAACLVWLLLKDRYRFLIALIAVLFIATTLLPHAVLINHLETQYAWLGAFFFFAPLLLVDGLLPTGRGVLTLLAAGAVLACFFTMREDRKDFGGMAGWLRGQEINERKILRDWPLVQKTVRPNEHDLVLGLDVFNSPFRTPSFLKRTLPQGITWTVIVPDLSGVSDQSGVQFIHAADFHPANFDHVFVYSNDCQLDKVYSGPEFLDLLRSRRLPASLGVYGPANNTQKGG